MVIDRLTGDGEHRNDDSHDAGLDLLWSVDTPADPPARRSYARLLANAAATRGARGKVAGATVGGFALVYAVVFGPFLTGSAAALFRSPPPTYVALGEDESDFRPYREPRQRVVAAPPRPAPRLLPPVQDNAIPGYVRALAAAAKATPRPQPTELTRALARPARAPVPALAVVAPAAPRTRANPAVPKPAPPEPEPTRPAPPRQAPPQPAPPSPEPPAPSPTRAAPQPPARTAPAAQPPAASKAPASTNLAPPAARTAADAAAADGPAATAD